MVSLGTIDKERVFFHLGYGSRVAIDAADIARTEQACTEIYSDYLLSRIIDLLDILDETWEQLNLSRNTWYDTKEIHIGDVNRSSQRAEPQRQQRIWQSEYNRLTNELAKMLRVTNYNDPNAWQWTHDRNAQAYINVIPGPADTSVESRIISVARLGSGVGD